MIHLSVVIPAANEAENLAHLLPKVSQVLVSLGVPSEVVIVDGGSRDGTAQVARVNGARFLSQSGRGYGNALVEGFQQARGDYVITMDADLSHDPGVITRLWAARSEAEVVIASRYVPGGSAQMGLLRYLLSRALNLTFPLLLGLTVRDISSGFRLYHRVRVLPLRLRGRDFDVLIETLFKTIQGKGRVIEVPFTYRPRLRGTSHVRLWRFALSYLRTLLRLAGDRWTQAEGKPCD